MGKTKIKASAVNNLTDARYFAAREVEWLGFRLDDTTSFMAAKAIAEWVDGVKIVGEFDFSTAEEILAAHAQLRFDAVEIGRYMPLHELEKLEGIPVIQSIVVEKTSNEADLVAFLNERAPFCSYFLLDFEKSGITWAMLKAGMPVSVAFLNSIFAQQKTLVALVFQGEELGEMLEMLHPHGLSLMGGDEEKVGFKSFDELDEILDGLEATV
ncbi:MAG: hypothetical protein IT258_00230 [Saprospiraceae bacterium]|nr:hypothetical protein [Saprospiraceae bacterium]